MMENNGGVAALHHLRPLYRKSFSMSKSTGIVGKSRTAESFELTPDRYGDGVAFARAPMSFNSQGERQFSSAEESGFVSPSAMALYQSELPAVLRPSPSSSALSASRDDRAAYLMQMDAVAKNAYYKAVHDLQPYMRRASPTTAPQPIIIQNSTNTSTTAESAQPATNDKEGLSVKILEFWCQFWSSRLNRFAVLLATGASVYFLNEWRLHRRQMDLWDKRLEASPMLSITRKFSRFIDKPNMRYR
eukprot:Lankesteria_metandrocarpae@DN818_c0_g1_i1.p1